MSVCQRRIFAAAQEDVLFSPQSAQSPMSVWMLCLQGSGSISQLDLQGPALPSASLILCVFIKLSSSEEYQFLGAD